MNDSSTQPSDIGALARIDKATMKAAFDAVSGQTVYDLALEINDRIPNNPGFVRFAMAFTITPEVTARNSPFESAIEMIVGTLHVSTHLDALVHVQSEGRIYGGHLSSEARDDRGWTKHGVETVPPILGRGVILDIARLKGVDRLPDLYEITVDDIKGALAAVGEKIGNGDIVLVRTGKMLQYGEPDAFLTSEPGVGREAAIWMYDQGMALLGTDTTGTEPFPFPDLGNTTHRAMLVERGVHLIENVNLEEVCSKGVSRGLFIALPLKITGATGSWLRPVLVV